MKTSAVAKTPDRVRQETALSLLMRAREPFRGEVPRKTNFDVNRIVAPMNNIDILLREHIPGVAQERFADPLVVDLDPDTVLQQFIAEAPEAPEVRVNVLLKTIEGMKTFRGVSIDALVEAIRKYNFSRDALKYTLKYTKHSFQEYFDKTEDIIYTFSDLLTLDTTESSILDYITTGGEFFLTVIKENYRVIMFLAAMKLLVSIGTLLVIPHLTYFSLLSGFLPLGIESMGGAFFGIVSNAVSSTIQGAQISMSFQVALNTLASTYTGKTLLYTEIPSDIIRQLLNTFGLHDIQEQLTVRGVIEMLINHGRNIGMGLSALFNYEYAEFFYASGLAGFFVSYTVYGISLAIDKTITTVTDLPAAVSQLSASVASLKAKLMSSGVPAKTDYLVDITEDIHIHDTSDSLQVSDDYLYSLSMNKEQPGVDAIKVTRGNRILSAVLLGLTVVSFAANEQSLSTVAEYTGIPSMVSRFAMDFIQHKTIQRSLLGRLIDRIPGYAEFVELYSEYITNFTLGSVNEVYASIIDYKKGKPFTNQLLNVFFGEIHSRESMKGLSVHTIRRLLVDHKVNMKKFPANWESLYRRSSRFAADIRRLLHKKQKEKVSYFRNIIKGMVSNTGKQIVNTAIQIPLRGYFELDRTAKMPHKTQETLTEAIDRLKQSVSTETPLQKTDASPEYIARDIDHNIKVLQTIITPHFGPQQNIPIADGDALRSAVMSGKLREYMTKTDSGQELLANDIDVLSAVLKNDRSYNEPTPQILSESKLFEESQRVFSELTDTLPKTTEPPSEKVEIRQGPIILDTLIRNQDIFNGKGEEITKALLERGPLFGPDGWRLRYKFGPDLPPSTTPGVALFTQNLKALNAAIQDPEVSTRLADFLSSKRPVFGPVDLPVYGPADMPVYGPYTDPQNIFTAVADRLKRVTDTVVSGKDIPVTDTVPTTEIILDSHSKVLDDIALFKATRPEAPSVQVPWIDEIMAKTITEQVVPEILTEATKETVAGAGVVKEVVDTFSKTQNMIYLSTLDSELTVSDVLESTVSVLSAIKDSVVFTLDLVHKVGTSDVVQAAVNDPILFTTTAIMDAVRLVHPEASMPDVAAYIRSKYTDPQLSIIFGISQVANTNPWFVRKTLHATVAMNDARNRMIQFAKDTTRKFADSTKSMARDAVREGWEYIKQDIYNDVQRARADLQEDIDFAKHIFDIGKARAVDISMSGMYPGVNIEAAREFTNVEVSAMGALKDRSYSAFKYFLTNPLGPLSSVDHHVLRENILGAYRYMTSGADQRAPDLRDTLNAEIKEVSDIIHKAKIDLMRPIDHPESPVQKRNVFPEIRRDTRMDQMKRFIALRVEYVKGTSSEYTSSLFERLGFAKVVPGDGQTVDEFTKDFTVYRKELDAQKTIIRDIILTGGYDTKNPELQMSTILDSQPTFRDQLKKYTLADKSGFTGYLKKIGLEFKDPTKMTQQEFTQYFMDYIKIVDRANEDYVTQLEEQSFRTKFYAALDQAYKRFSGHIEPFTGPVIVSDIGDSIPEDAEKTVALINDAISPAQDIPIDPVMEYWKGIQLTPDNTRIADNYYTTYGGQIPQSPDPQQIAAELSRLQREIQPGLLLHSGFQAKYKSGLVDPNLLREHLSKVSSDLDLMAKTNAAADLISELLETARNGILADTPVQTELQSEKVETTLVAEKKAVTAADVIKETQGRESKIRFLREIQKVHLAHLEDTQKSKDTDVPLPPASEGTSVSEFRIREVIEKLLMSDITRVFFPNQWKKWMSGITTGAAAVALTNAVGQNDIHTTATIVGNFVERYINTEGGVSELDVTSRVEQAFEALKAGDDVEFERVLMLLEQDTRPKGDVNLLSDPVGTLRRNTIGQILTSGMEDRVYLTDVMMDTIIDGYIEGRSPQDMTVTFLSRAGGVPMEVVSNLLDIKHIFRGS